MKLANISSTYRSKLIAKTFTGWIKNNTRVLDVGCGTGIVSRELKNNFNLNLIGCDIEKYILSNIPFKKINNINKLPFRSNTFDCCLFIDMLHHTSYETQERLLKEGCRVANVLLIFELKETTISRFLDYLLNKIHNPHMAIPHTYRSKRQWQLLGKKLGLKVEMRSIHRPLLYPFNHMAIKFSK